MKAISDLPMPHDMDADYSPHYVKLARILRDQIKAGSLKRPDPLPATGLAAEYGVSVRIAYAALEMLEANRYVTRPKRFQCYRVAWQAPSEGRAYDPAHQRRGTTDR
jgi:DNA-binding GntR family transcriptional regulator